MIFSIYVCSKKLRFKSCITDQLLAKYGEEMKIIA